MEKNNTDSMTTVQMKADYAASEIYSTTSEAPPAYPMREASSVKIAKIIAMTVLLSSLIFGSFVLGSVYLQARASCDQMQALDSMLEKELMLETLQQELPKAEALLQNAGENDDDDEKALGSNSLLAGAKKSTAAEQLGGDSDPSYSDADESADLNRGGNGDGVNVKLPLELNLSELAHAIMQSQQKSRMNCVIERRQAEEIVDDSMVYGGGEPRKRITGERMAIFCESGTESKAPEPQAEQIPPIMMRPVSYGPIPQHFPLTHMPMQMEPRPQRNMLSPPPPPPMMQQQLPHPQQPQPPQSTVMRVFPQQFIVRQIHLQPQSPSQQQSGPAFMHPMNNGPQQPQPQQQQQQHQPQQPHLVALRFNMPPPPQSPDQVLTAPRPMMPMSLADAEDRPLPYQIRNELLELQKQHQQQREMMQPQPMQLQPQPPHGVQLQRVPLSLALQRVGITPDDLRNIQRMAEDRIKEEVQQLNAEFKHIHEAAAAAGTQQGHRGQSTDASSSSSSASSSSNSYSDSSSTDADNSSSDDDSSAELNERTNGGDSEEDSQILQIGRTAFGRSVVTPIRIPVNLMQAITQAENMEAKAADAEHRSLVDESRVNIGEDSER